MSIANRWGLPLALLLAFFLAVPATPAWSEEEPEEPTEETEEEEIEGATIEWVEGFAEGQKVATAEGKLMFVYFGRKSPT